LPKSYLVTGGAGFIGSHICDALLRDGQRLVVLDNFRSGKRSNLSRASGDLTIIEGDVRQLDRFAGQVGQVDAVVHLAALISGYDSLSAPDDYVDINVDGLLRVIEFATARGVPRIVFASSSTVYGNQAGVPLTETTAPEPLTVYALTKLAGEHLLRLYGAMHGFTHCSLRLFNVYGPRQAPDHPYANVTCKFSHAAAHGLPVNLYGDGEQSRDFVYVADVVRAFMAVLDRSDASIYNVGTGHTARINQLIDELEQIGGRALEVKRQAPWPNDIRSIRASTDRFAGEFGFRPEVPLSEGLRRTVEFFQEEAASADG
jgi:UDP-glucose 4-epimerase